MVSAAGVETTEYHYLTMDERKALIQRTYEFVDGRVPVVVGVSHPNVRTAIGLAHMAEEMGADAIQVLARSARSAARRHSTTSSPISRRSAPRRACRSCCISTPAPVPT